MLHVACWYFWIWIRWGRFVWFTLSNRKRTKLSQQAWSGLGDTVLLSSLTSSLFTDPVRSYLPLLSLRNIHTQSSICRCFWVCLRGCVLFSHSRLSSVSCCWTIRAWAPGHRVNQSPAASEAPKQTSGQWSSQSDFSEQRQLKQHNFCFCPLVLPNCSMIHYIPAKKDFKISKFFPLVFVLTDFRDFTQFHKRYTGRKAFVRYKQVSP